MLIQVLQYLVGWSSTPTEVPFGSGSRDEAVSVKGKIVNLISSVRTLMRSECQSNPQPLTWLRPVEMCMAKGSRKSLDGGLIENTVPLIVINTLMIVYALVLG